MLSTSIKEATKEAHLSLEKKVIEKLKGIRSNADYADFLKHFYAYFNHLEQAISGYITADLLPDYKERRNSSYLKKDIIQLGFDVNELPQTTVPQINNALEAMAALYVMEGSIMGGSIIVKMLEKGGITKGVSFFSGYGENTGQMWGTFITVLNQQSHQEDDDATAIYTANETFKHFSEVFGAVKVS